MIPVTWQMVRAYVDSMPVPITNRAVAEALDVDRHDVGHLTRMMANAGEIRRLSQQSGSAAHVYVRIDR